MDVSATPEQYRAYIQGSRGEFSCVKPYCIQFANAWISDRTLCYLASGKPAVVQHTGASRFLPDAEGLFRFRSMDEAVRALAAVEADYERTVDQRARWPSNTSMARGSSRSAGESAGVIMKGLNQAGMEWGNARL